MAANDTTRRGIAPSATPKDGFDEGVDLDSLMPAIQLVLLAVSTTLLVSLRRKARAASPPAGRESAAPATRRDNEQLDGPQRRPSRDQRLTFTASAQAAAMFCP